MKVWPIFLTLLHFVLVLVWALTKNPAIAFESEVGVKLVNIAGILGCCTLGILKLMTHTNIPWIFALLWFTVVVCLLLNFWLINFKCDKTKQVVSQSKINIVFFSVSWTIGIVGVLIFFMYFLAYLKSPEWKEKKKSRQELNARLKELKKKKKKTPKKPDNGLIELPKL